MEQEKHDDSGGLSEENKEFLRENDVQVDAGETTFRSFRDNFVQLAVPFLSYFILSFIVGTTIIPLLIDVPTLAYPFIGLCVVGIPALSYLLVRSEAEED